MGFELRTRIRMAPPLASAKALLLRLAFLCTAAAVSATAARADCSLRVGWDEWPPYFTQVDGKFHGPEYDMLRATAEAAGCKLDFLQVPWARAQRLLAAGELDLLYGAGHSAEREGYAKFSISYREERFVLVTRQEEGGPGETVSLDAWIRAEDTGRPRSVGVFRGNVYGAAIDGILAANPQQVVIIELSQNKQMTRMLEEKRLDGYLIEDAVAALQLAPADHGLRRLLIAEQKGDPLYYLFSLKVGDDVIERFNAAIRKRKSGNS